MLDQVEEKYELNHKKKSYEQLFVFMWPFTATREVEGLSTAKFEILSLKTDFILSSIIFIGYYGFQDFNLGAFINNSCRKASKTISLLEENYIT